MSEKHTAENDAGPECDLCGKTTCPDADLPEFSEPRSCAFTPIYEALRYDRCEYGCARDVTKATIRRDIIPAMARIFPPAPTTGEDAHEDEAHHADGRAAL